ncbi:MAG: precorrin-3B C(17)-methyltransferase [Propionibacteriaceae bacterium]|jgi:precorrin-3B C17-methyltransferase|nr:precorrin-3B C(17)-methyltransferase [Propionibacteriaceae bacterium]
MKLLTLVGMGPGDHAGMTYAADEALRLADVIVGYKRYIQLIRPMYPDKEFVATGMTHEVDRCRQGLELAATDKRVALVSSGDAGVYAMGGLVYELSVDFPEVEITVVPGVTAATSGAALLGAPIGHDFAVISLSDRLTDWSTIEQRLDVAGQADFCVVLYNPSSRSRKNHLARARDILMRHKSGDTVCGLAQRIGRAGEASTVTTLARLRDEDADMFTTVFVGNHSTRVIKGRMVTPRGYENSASQSRGMTPSHTQPQDKSGSGDGQSAQPEMGTK